jgi:glycosyltransferase involved in cell wall biosynthesis
MTTSKSELSVIIPFHGETKDLLNCINALQNQDFKYSFNVTIVESGNQNKVKHLNFPPNVTLISNESLLFSGAARNVGVANSNTELLAFIDADCVPSRNWLSKIYSSLKGENEIVVGPITNLYPFHPIASVDNLLQFVDFQKYRQSNISHFPGCNFGITKSLFMKTGGYPGKFKNGEDVLFSQTAIKKSHGKILFNPAMIVKHCGRRNIRELIHHNKSFGFYRGYLGLKLTTGKNRFRVSYLYAFLFGLRRLTYITVRTLQWNPIGVLRLIFFLPIFILGLLAWVKGFYEGTQKLLVEDLNLQEE